MYEPKLYPDERILYYSEKHWFWLIKRGRKVYFDHPEADKRVLSDVWGDLDDTDIIYFNHPEKAGKHNLWRFKAALNGMINAHNASGVDHRI